MDSSKPEVGAARDGSNSVVEPDGDLFSAGSDATNSDRSEGYVNSYAEASQAFEIGRRPRPIDGAQLAQPKPTARIAKQKLVQTAKPAVAEKPDQQTKIEEKPIKKAAQALDNLQQQTSSADLPRLMRVEDVAAYMNVSTSKIWRLNRKNPDFPSSIKMDGTTRWDRLDIDHFIETSKMRGRAGL